MSAIKLASRYARAFVELSVEQDRLQQVYEDMVLVQEVLSGSRELQLFVKSPIIKPDAKQKVFDALFGNKLSDITAGYIRLIISKGRESYLSDIIQAFIGMYNDINGIVHIKVTSANDLTAEDEVRLSSMLMAETGAKEVRIEKKTDPSLIGGFVIHMGDRVYDATVSEKLKKLKKQLINA